MPWGGTLSERIKAYCQLHRSKSLAGMVLPVALVFLNLLLNDRALLPEKFLNKRWKNIVNWTIIAVLFTLSGVLVL